MRPLPSFGTLALATFFLGCSGSDSGETFQTGSLAAFTSYCVGTLEEDVGVGESMGPGAWHFSSTFPEVSAGTAFLVASDWNKWEGYVVGKDGTPRKLSSDHDTGLVRGKHFSAACATDDELSDYGSMVLLKDSTFFPNQDLTGTPCQLPVATELTSHGFASGLGEVTAKVHAEQITSTCGLADAYTKDMVYGELIDLQGP